MTVLNQMTQANVDDCLTMYLTSLKKVGLSITWTDIQPFEPYVSPAVITLARLLIEGEK